MHVHRKHHPAAQLQNLHSDTMPVKHVLPDPNAVLSLSKKPCMQCTTFANIIALQVFTQCRSLPR